MSEMSLAEKVALTLALDNELRAIWGHGRVSVAIHYQTHTDVHEAAEQISSIAAHVNGEWQVSADIGVQFHSPRMFAPADLECVTCRALITETAIREERAHVVR